MHEERVSRSFPAEYSLVSVRRLSRSSSSNLLVTENSGLFEDCVPYVRYFVHQHVKYLWNKNEMRFEMLNGIERGIRLNDFHRFSGYPPHVQEIRSIISII